MKASLNSEALYTASADVCLYLCVFYKVTHRLHFMQHSALRFPHVWITPPAWHTHSHTLFCWDSQCGWASSSSLHSNLPFPSNVQRSREHQPWGRPSRTQRELSESLPLQMQHLWLWLLTIRTLCVCVKTE